MITANTTYLLLLLTLTNLLLLTAATSPTFTLCMATRPGSNKATYHDILTSLRSTDGAANAVAKTIERDPSNAYSFHRYCRRRFVTDDANRDPQYLHRVRHFQHVHFSPQDPEWDLLTKLMEGSLRSQYRVETSRKSFFPGRPDLDAALRQIKCLPPAFYEYVLPDEIVERALDREQERREEAHCRAINIADIQTIVSRAKTWEGREHPWELLACASILCGRRTQEIIWAAEFTIVSKYVVHVKGLLKQAVGEGDIPLLVEAEEFLRLLAKIRENQLPIESTTHRLKPAFVRIFGEWFNHTQRRNIYCEAAFRLRQESGFYPEHPRLFWFDKALCHDRNVIHQAPSLIYQSLTFNE